MATSQDILAAHPSVQDLDMDATKLNPRKVHYHKLVINSGPLHVPSEHGKNSVVKKNVPKGQTVTTVRNDENLKAAARAMRVPSDYAVPPALAPAKLKVPSAAQQRPPSSTNSSAGKGSRLTSEKLAGLHSNEDEHKLPPVPSASQPAPIGPRRPSSIVSSKVSFVATDAESFSVYSCSCCHVKPPSSYAGNASDYDNLTSISQRPSNHPSRAGADSVSVTSTKLRTLEDHLKREREDRIKTQQELSLIQQRQQLLLSKLSAEERKRLDELMGST